MVALAAQRGYMMTTAMSGARRVGLRSFGAVLLLVYGTVVGDVFSEPDQGAPVALNKIREIEGRRLPLEVPIISGGAFERGDVLEGGEEGLEFLLFMRVPDPVAAVSFYDGVLSRLGCLQRGTPGNLSAGWRTPTPTREKFDEGTWFHVRYGASDAPYVVWLTVRQGDEDDPAHDPKRPYRAIVSVVDQSRANRVALGASAPKVEHLQVVASVKGEPLPVAIPVMPGAKFTHGDVADLPEGREYLVYLGASDFEGAVRFYDGVFWQHGCVERGPVGNLHGGYQGAPSPKDALAAGKWFHVRYGPNETGEGVWLTVRKADERHRREGYEYTVVLDIIKSKVSHR